MIIRRITMIVIVTVVVNSGMALSSDIKSEYIEMFKQKLQESMQTAPDSTYLARAQNYYNQAITYDTTDSRFWEYAALSYYALGDYYDAIPFFERFYSLGRDNIRMRVAGLADDISSLRSAYQKNPFDYVILRELAGTFVIQNDHPDSAIKYLNKILELDEQDVPPNVLCETYGNLGYCYLIKKDAKSAQKALKSAIACKPEDIDYLYNLATAYLMDNNIEEAKVYYNKICELYPQSDRCTEIIKEIPIK